MKASSRNTGIDLLRSVAVILVLFHHLDVCGKVPAFLGHELVELLIRGGWVGVDCFFVLSGFLVSGLLFREYSATGGIRSGRFLIRRGLKIYPAFYCMLAVTTIVYAFSGHEFTVSSFLGELLFFQNYVGNLWRHTWSLAVEEHFYLLLVPLLLMVFRLRRGKSDQSIVWTIGGIYLFLAVVCLLFRSIRVAEISDFSPKFHQFQTHLRIDSLFLGVLICALSRAYPSKFKSMADHWVKRTTWFAFGLFLWTPVFIFEISETPWLWSWGFLIFSWGGACLLMAFLPIQRTNFKPLQMLAKMGTYSYSIYLWHMMVGGWVATRIQAKLGGDWWIGAACYFCLSIFVGVLLSKAIEWPILEVRDRFFPSIASKRN